MSTVRRWVSSSAVLVVILITTTPARAEATPSETPPALGQGHEALAAPSDPTAAPFDPEAATGAYLATVPADARARSDAYFEGGYWLQVIDFVVGLAVALALLASGLSRRMRDLSERLVRPPALRTLLYWVQYLLLTTVVLLPLSLYEGFFRERRYGLSNQTLGEWLGDQAKGLALGLVLGGVAVVALYAVIRRLPRTWALWGALTATVLMVLGIVIAPVYVAPVFNDYTRLEDPVAKGPILQLARAQGVPAHDVWVFDASRQTKRVSANVSGLLGTMRVSLNDNLLNRCSLAEIEAVMGHEIGHYVLNHIYKSVLFFGGLIVIGFALLRWAFAAVTARWGSRWALRGIADPAALPLVVALVSAYFFVLTPVTNTWTRTGEAEADLFGINASGQPDGEAKVDLMLGEYRKLAPSPLEEIVFFDHPSGRNRILMAMRWKAEHLADARRNAERAAAADARRGYSEASAAAWMEKHAPAAR